MSACSTPIAKRFLSISDIKRLPYVKTPKSPSKKRKLVSKLYEDEEPFELFLKPRVLVHPPPFVYSDDEDEFLANMKDVLLNAHTRPRLS